MLERNDFTSVLSTKNRTQNSDLCILLYNPSTTSQPTVSKQPRAALTRPLEFHPVHSCWLPRLGSWLIQSGQSLGSGCHPAHSTARWKTVIPFDTLPSCRWKAKQRLSQPRINACYLTQRLIESQGMMKFGSNVAISGYR
jgi:hypothetical protein